METSKKLTHGVQPDTPLEAERIEPGNDQADQPLPAVCGFPQPGLRMDAPARDGLRKTMHTTLRQPRLLGNTAHTLRAILTQTRENLEAFLPKSHVGRLSEGGLNSGRNSAPQRT